MWFSFFCTKHILEVWICVVLEGWLEFRIWASVSPEWMGFVLNLVALGAGAILAGRTVPSMYCLRPEGNAISVAESLVLTESAGS